MLGFAHEGTIGSQTQTAGDLCSGLCEWLLHTRFHPAGLESSGDNWRGSTPRTHTCLHTLSLQALLDQSLGEKDSLRTVFFSSSSYGGKVCWQIRNICIRFPSMWNTVKRLATARRLLSSAATVGLVCLSPGLCKMDWTDSHERAEKKKNTESLNVTANEKPVSDVRLLFSFSSVSCIWHALYNDLDQAGKLRRFLWLRVHNSRQIQIEKYDQIIFEHVSRSLGSMLEQEHHRQRQRGHYGRVSVDKWPV